MAANGHSAQRCSCFADFQKRRGARLQPTDAPRQLPAPMEGLDAGAIPSAEELRVAAAAVDADL